MAVGGEDLVWLQDAVVKPRLERDPVLRDWKAGPHARFCHPREEHLVPLHVVAGAAGDDPGKVVFTDEVMGARVSAVQFG